MNKFLQSVAKDMKVRIGKDLSSTIAVFPNKRAALFFDRYLAEGEKHPIWSPRYLTISELFREACPAVSVPDTIGLVCRLYHAYRTVTAARIADGRSETDASPETLDYFYQWGETLLSDFDDIDKNLIDARSLFQQIDDWNKMEDTGYISPEMEQRIRHFFAGFSADKLTKLKTRFIQMWEKLGDIYTQFNSDLESEGMAYEGALYRRVAEQGTITALPYDNFAFIGFNVIDKVEELIFRQLADDGRALFYWDYDRTWDNDEAGRFVRKNIEKFPNSLPDAVSEPDTAPDITVISSKTGDMQAQYAGQWLSDNKTDDESDTAIVLCDEGQLQQVMHTLPHDVRALNVTMGYPLAQTPVASFINCLAGLQDSYDFARQCFSHQCVCKLLRHPYAPLLSPLASGILAHVVGQNLFYPRPGQLCTADGRTDDTMQAVFTPQTDNSGFCNYVLNLITIVARTIHDNREGDAHDGTEDAGQGEAALFTQLYNESLFQAYTTFSRFASLIDSGTLDVGRPTMLRLIDRVMKGISIPFHGEPAVGLQVMGMLETRNLDFRHIIMLNVNEGMLPRHDDRPSFIPDTLRRAFGMTTPDRRVAVFAYYFFRLVRRCERLCLVYNDEVENGKKNEMSRFILQLIARHGCRIHNFVLVPRLKPGERPQIAIPRDNQTLGRLKARFADRTTGGASRDIDAWLAAWADNPGARRTIWHTTDRLDSNRRILSPSAINVYLDCRLKFYFRYIARLKPSEEMSQDIDSALFGTIFHATAEEVYDRLASDDNFIDAPRIRQALHGDNAGAGAMPVDDIVDFYFRKYMFKQAALDGIDSLAAQVKAGIECPGVEYNGIQLINRAVIIRLVRKLLDIDTGLGGFHYIGSEVNVSRPMTIRLNDGTDINLRLGGNIDRIDYVTGGQSAAGGTLRVIDYKTGASKATAKDLDTIFARDEKHSGYHLQTLLYASIISDLTGGKVAVSPALLYIQKQRRDESPALKIGRDEVNDIRPIKREVDEGIASIVTDIFCGTDDYTQTDDESRCAYCDFKALCGR